MSFHQPEPEAQTSLSPQASANQPEGDAAAVLGTVEPRPAMTVVMTLAVVMWAVFGAVSLFMLVMSVMLFDAPGSENNPWIWGMIYSMAATPVLSALVTIPGSIYGLWRESRRPLRRRTIWLLAALPAVGGVMLAVCWVALAVFCDGQLSCAEPWALP